MRKLTLYLLLFFTTTLALNAQTAKDEAKLAERLNNYFQKYKAKGTRLTQAPRMLDYQLDATAKTLVLVTAAVGLISHIIYFAVVGAAGIMAIMSDNVIVP